MQKPRDDREIFLTMPTKAEHAYRKLCPLQCMSQNSQAHQSTGVGCIYDLFQPQNGSTLNPKHVQCSVPGARRGSARNSVDDTLEISYKGRLASELQTHKVSNQEQAK